MPSPGHDALPDRQLKDIIDGVNVALATSLQPLVVMVIYETGMHDRV